MMITMITARAVQMSGNQVVGVITMGHCFMTAFRAMLVSFFVAFASVIRRAYGLVCIAIGQAAFIYMIFMYMMQMIVVKVIGVIIVFDSSVTA